MDENWHGICPAIFKGIDGEERERMHCKYVEIGRAVNIRHPSTSRKAKTLWMIREAKAKEASSREVSNRSKFVWQYGRHCGRSTTEPGVGTRRGSEKNRCGRDPVESSTAGGSRT